MPFGEIIDSVSEIIGTLAEPVSAKINCPTEEMEKLVASAYMRQCIIRGSAFEPNNEVERNIRSVAKWLTDPTTKPWLLMYGKIGSGKSTMAEAIALVIQGLKLKTNETIVILGGEIERDMLRALFLNIPDYVAINATDLCYIAENKPEEYAKIVAVPILIIDDLGTEPVAIKRYGTNTQPVVEMLYDRYDNMLATVITSNMDIDRIGRSYGERIKDRMREMCNILEFKHDSYRR